MNTESIFPAGDSEFDGIYAEEAAMVDASELIAAALEGSGLSRTELAEALGVNKSEITARLNGERNITVRKLAATLHALGQRLELNCVDRPTTESGERRRYREWRYPSLQQNQFHAPAHNVIMHRAREWRYVMRAQ